MRLLGVPSLCVCLLLSACLPVESIAPAPPPLSEPLAPAPPDELGPYGIGVTTIEGVADADGQGRTFPVEVWYPADVSGSEPVARYQLKLGALVAADLESPRGAVRDAPLDYRGAPHPVVVFSHGFGGTRMQSVYLTEVLASHGFVVAAPDHVGNTFAEQVDKAKAVTALEAARLRPGDVSRTLDELLERSDGWPAEPLAYAADPTRVAVVGHSFGGFTALRIAGGSIDVALGDAACEADPSQFFCDGWPGEKPLPGSARDDRFIAALPQAPGGSMAFTGGGLGDIHVPTMLQAGTADATTPYDSEAVAPFAELTSPAYLLTIADAGHFTFSDMCALVELIGLSVEEFDDGCGPDNVSAEVAHPLVTAYAVAFLRKHLVGDESVDAYLAAPPPSGAELDIK